MRSSGLQPRLGVLVPEFPGQTHGFFWREMNLLQQIGLTVEMLSTRPPPDEARARHDWSREAQACARQLAPLGMAGGLGLLLESIRAAGQWVPLLRAALGMDAMSATARVRQLALAAMAMRLRRACRLLNIRHLHVHSCADSAVLAALCRQAGGPSYSLVLHSPIACFGGNQRMKWMGADFGVVVSRCVGNELSALYGDALPSEMLVSSMGFDETVFTRSAPYRPWHRGEPLRLAACSRVSNGKGIDTLIEVVARLRGCGVDARLRVAGGCDSGVGGVLVELGRLAERLGVSGRVEFLGSCSALRIRELLQESHVFLTATRQEAIGVAIMEAMAMALPVVASRVGGIPELIEDGRSGVLVPVDSPQAMVEAICSIVSAPGRAEQLGRAAAERVGREFTSRSSAERLAEVLVRRHPDLVGR